MQASADDQYDYRARRGVPLPFVDIRARGDDGELIEWDDRAMGKFKKTDLREQFIGASA